MRSYAQFCGLAGALDVVGERWTLLVVRELMTGPQRFSDLAAHLGGVGSSILTERLRRLEAAGVVRRAQLPPPAASAVYELTDAGHDLGRALMPLVRWGLRHAVPEDRADGASYRAAWALLPFVYEVSAGALGELSVIVVFEVDGELASLVVERGIPRVRDGDTSYPDARVRTDAATLAALGAGRLDLEAAMAEGRLALEGDRGAFATLVSALSPIG